MDVSQTNNESILPNLLFFQGFAIFCNLFAIYLEKMVAIFSTFFTNVRLTPCLLCVKASFRFYAQSSK